MKGAYGDLLIGVVIGVVIGGTLGISLSTLPTLVSAVAMIVLLVYGLKFLGLR